MPGPRPLAPAPVLGDAAAPWTSGRRPDAQPDADRVVLSVAVAAARLGVTPDAVRARLHRGTLDGTKVAGEWRVLVSRPDAQPDARQDADRAPDAALLESKGELIAELRAEVGFLRDQLAERSRELAAGRERFDVIHREALVRLEALTAGEPDASEPHGASRGRPGATDGADRTSDASVGAGGASRPWWRRLLGIWGEGI